MAIFLTGDTHGEIDFSKLNIKNFPLQSKLTKKDYVIICGDFGAIWDNNPRKNEWLLNWWNTRNYTTLFTDGNHENFNLLNQYPVLNWNGGKIHQIKDSVFHLMRGQIFNIDGLRFFTMGGATSVDKENRSENITWWKEELPNYKEEIEALTNLEKENFEVDYILTHTAPQSIIDEIASGFKYGGNSLTKLLEEIRQAAVFRKWFFGHFHIDYQCKTDIRLQAVYNNIYQIGE